MEFKILVSRLLRSFGSVFPARKKESSRHKKGIDLNSSMSLVLLCKDSNEAELNKRKKFLNHIKGEYGVRQVLLFCFTENEKKDIPPYLGHLKELDFFSLEDLNWRFVPKAVLTSFCKENFDILIDLSSEACEPLEHVISASKAKMKIVRKNSVYEKYADFIVEIPKEKSEEEFLKETEYILSNFSFK